MLAKRDEGCARPARHEARHHVCLGESPLPAVAPGPLRCRGVDSAAGCELYKAAQLRLHAPGHDPFFAAMLKQLGVGSFIRLSGSHYNTPTEIELFLKRTAELAGATV